MRISRNTGGGGSSGTNCLKAVSGMTYEVKPSTHRFFQMFLL